MVLLIIILAALLLAAGIPFFASLVVPVIAALVVYMPDMPLSIVFHKMFNGVGCTVLYFWSGNHCSGFNGTSAR
jgi:hypothetical protein